MSKKPTYIHGIIGSQLRDTQGEMLSIEGADISELEAGRGRFNDNHGVGYWNSLGRIEYAKKIFKAEDCEDDHQRYFWEKIKAPMIYAKGYLYDAEDHPNAKAAAAIIRNIHRTDSPLKCKFSVEGGVISRGIADPSLLARTKIHSAAVTFTPANNATLVEPLNLDKSSASWESDLYIIKSVMHLAKTDVPSFRHITRMASAEKIADNIKKANLLAQQVGFTPFSVEPTADQLIKYALEKKIVDNVAKINNLVKELSKNRSLNATHPSFTQNKNTQSIIKPGEGSVYEISSGKRTVDPNDANTLLEQNKTPNTPHNKNKAINAIDVHETQHANDYNIAKQLKNQDGKEIDGDDFASHALHNAGFDDHEKHFINHFVSAYTDGYYGVGDPAEVTSVLTEAVSNPNARKAAVDRLKEHIPGETYESTTQRLKDINTKLRNTYGQYEAGQKIDVPSNEDYHSNFESAPKEYKPANNKVNKALTAGYGGAGAPGSMTGGSVIQSESLDDGRRGFKYITCDDCGDESVYMKHQVKCRKCNKSYSLAKLLPLMTK
jgi:hypothetical protein